MNQPSLLDGVSGVQLLGATREAVRLKMLRKSLPPSTWRPDESYPDLSAATLFGIDTESRDPHLHDRGPGYVRGDADVVGVSLYAEFSNRESYCKYYPIGHANGTNLEKSRVVPWLNQTLSGPQPKIGANLLYDLEGLHFTDVKVQGPIWDVQIAGPLLDEEKDSYSLDNLMSELLGRGKSEDTLKPIAELMGVKLSRKNGKLHIKEKDVKAALWKMPPEYVAPYAEDDAAGAVEVFKKQRVMLENEDVWKVFLKESALVPLLLKMRIRGVPVNVAGAEEVKDKLTKLEADKQRMLNAMVGLQVDVWAPLSLRAACIKMNVPFNRTQTWNKTLNDNNPSFTKDWLASMAAEVPFLKLSGEIRKMSKMRRDFVEAFILSLNVRGRLHCQFHQLRKATNEEGEKEQEGTRTGRFSSSNPNLQQIPARDKVYGPMIRGLFVPEHGARWGCFDYSAQEPRVTVHYAFLMKYPGAAEAVAKYHADPNTDYHQMVADMADIARKEAKEVNLGLAYGMGFWKLGFKLGRWTEKEAIRYDLHDQIPKDKVAEVAAILAKYHEGVPFVKPLMDNLTHTADTRGFIRTLWGRRRRFDNWEPRWRNADTAFGTIRGYDAAKAAFGDDVMLKRYGTHKALNALVQGSSADMMKEAMLVLDSLSYVPHLTVHDEIDDSIYSDKQFSEVKEAMQHAIKISVPLRVDAKLAGSWGEAK